MGMVNNLARDIRDEWPKCAIPLSKPESKSRSAVSAELTPGHRKQTEKRQRRAARKSKRKFAGSAEARSNELYPEIVKKLRDANPKLFVESIVDRTLAHIQKT